MIGKTFVLAAACAALVVSVAPAADASGGPGGGGGGGGGQTSCQIKQLSDVPVLFASSAAIDTTYSLAGCAGDRWGLAFVNTFFGTTDFTASGVVGATGAATGTVEAAPLPFNYPYRVTLTVSSSTGSLVTSKAATLFTPKPRD